jgi:hypothetical protein
LSSINGATVPRQQLLYAYPEFTAVSITNAPAPRIIIRYSPR